MSHSTQTAAVKANEGGNELRLVSFFQADIYWTAILDIDSSLPFRSRRRIHISLSLRRSVP